MKSVNATTYELLLAISGFFPLITGLIVVNIAVSFLSPDDPFAFGYEVGTLFSFFIPTFPYVIGLVLPLAKKNIIQNGTSNFIKLVSIAVILYLSFFVFEFIFIFAGLDSYQYRFELAAIFVVNLLIFNLIPYFIIKKVTSDFSISIEKNIFVKGLLFTLAFGVVGFIFFISGFKIFSTLEFLFLFLIINITVQIILVRNWIRQWYIKKPSTEQTSTNTQMINAVSFIDYHRDKIPDFKL